MTRIPPKPSPLLAANGAAAAVLRDHVVVRLDTSTGDVDSVRVPFAARRIAIAPGASLVAVAGEGQLTIADFRGGGAELTSHRALPIEAVDRIDVDDDGVVVISSEADAAVVRVIPDGDVTSVPIAAGFHESLVLVPASGGAPVAHLVLSGATELSAVASFEANELVPVWQQAPQGAVRAGGRLAVYTTRALHLYELAATGVATGAGEANLDGVERIVADASGSCVVTLGATWDGSTDVLHLARIELDGFDRQSLDATGVGRDDALAWAPPGMLVRAWGATDPGRVEAQRGDGDTVAADVDAEVAAARR